MLTLGLPAPAVVVGGASQLLRPLTQFPPFPEPLPHTPEGAQSWERQLEWV